MGAMMAFFQSDGSCPLSMDIWKMVARVGAISLAVSLRNFVHIPSGPVALCGFRPRRSLATPSVEILSGGRSGWRLSPISGSGLSFSWLNTLVNWSFRISALDLLSVSVFPSFVREATLQLSHRLLLTKDQNFFGLAGKASPTMSLMYW